jgi:hypothetical protein
VPNTVETHWNMKDMYIYIKYVSKCLVCRKEWLSLRGTDYDYNLPVSLITEVFCKLMFNWMKDDDCIIII